MVGEIPWGTHFCSFFGTKADLLDTLLPYFQAGLRDGELCIWMVAEPLGVDEARSELRRVVPDLDRELAQQSIEFHSARDWHPPRGALNVERLTGLWDEKIDSARRRGLAGLRVNANNVLSEDESRVGRSIAGKRMIALCSYPLATCGADQLLDVARTHQFALAKRNGEWDILDTDGLQQAKHEIVRLSAELEELNERTHRFDSVNRQQALQTIFDNIPVMISFYDASGRLLLVNRAWERTLGWTLEEAQRTDFLAEVYPEPDRRQEVLEFIQRAERRWGDFSARTRDGRTIDASWTRFALSDGSSIGFGLDISERKRTERALRESEAMFRQIAENINEVFWLAGPKLTDVSYVSPAYEQVFGRSRESLYREPMSWVEAIHPEDQERIRSAAFDMQSYPIDETYRVVRPDGSIRWIRDRGFPIRDGSGTVFRFAGVAEDITERRRVEDERARLFESETRSRAQAEATLERLRAIESITDAALSNLGLDDLLRELLARLRSTLQLEVASVRLIDEKRKELYVRAVDGVPLERMAHVGIPLDAAHLDAPFMTNDVQPPAPGQDDWYAKAWAALRLPLRAGMSVPLVVEGKPIGLVGVTSTRAPFTEADLHLLQVVADRVAPVIERGRLLESVRAGRVRQNVLSRRLLTAQEEERRHIAVELHDELGQVLTAVKISLASLERQMGCAPVSSHIIEAIGSVDHAIQRVRDLALDLRPSVLDDLGLAAALRWYVNRLLRSTRVEAHLSIDEVPHLDPDLEIACCRVAQEALTNVARHAQASQLWLRLHFQVDGFELTIRDDGVGFDATIARQLATAGGSMGLLGMEERVSLMGGEFEVRSTPGAGTEVRARFAVGERAPAGT